MNVSMNLSDVREKDRERAEIEEATARFLKSRRKVTVVPTAKRNNYIHRALVLPGSIDHTRGQMGRQGNESE